MTTQRHSYESLAQAYFFLFVFYPVQTVWWLVRLPFQLWFQTIRIGLHLCFTLVELWTSRVIYVIRKWILQPLGISRGSTHDAGTETPKVYDASKSYDRMQAYVLLLDEFDIAAVASMPFTPKTIEKWMTAKLSQGESAKNSPKMDDDTNKDTKNNHNHHNKKNKHRNRDRRPTLFHREHLVFVDLNGPDGWLRFSSDEKMHESKGPAMLNLRDCEVDVYPYTLAYPRFFSRSYPLRLSVRAAGGTQDPNGEALPAKEYFLMFPTGMEKERWFVGLRKATQHLDSSYHESYREREVLLLRQIVESHRLSQPHHQCAPPVPSKDGSTLKWGKKKGKGNKQAALAEELHRQQKEPSFSDLHQTDGVDTRWLNLLLSRMWMSMCDKRKLHDLLVSKIMTKISRVKRPTFLGEIKVQQLETGMSAPMFNNARIVSASEYGDVHLEMDMVYQGALRLVVETSATLDLVKSITVDIAVAVIIDEIKGKISIRTNPLPSSRIWWGFSEEPEIKVSMTPLVAATNVGFNMVKDVFEKKIKTTIRDTLVYPNMEDLCIFGCEASEISWGILDQPPTSIQDRDRSGSFGSLSDNSPYSLAATSPLASSPHRSAAMTPQPKRAPSNASTAQPRLSLSAASPTNPHPSAASMFSSTSAMGLLSSSSPGNRGLNPFQGISAYLGSPLSTMASSGGSIASNGSGKVKEPVPPPKDAYLMQASPLNTPKKQQPGPRISVEDDAVE